ncbi:MAG: GIY-YIG nuclease family protein [Armatimonadota bacterium]|nr:GIY-YIG nuclease family protein [Armatimonadota bacterium]
MIKGVYQLHLRLDKPKRIRVGKLGIFTFPAGRYIYTGSAMNGLIGRLRRHLKKRKKLHWHIDYLLRHAKIETIFVLETGERVECQLNSLTLSLPNAKVIVKGFGCSDCRCPSHLVYFGEGQG